LDCSSGLLKRDLLDFAGVHEFANEALFCNPCEPLKLFNLAGVAIHFVTFDFCCDSERMPYGLDGARPRWNLRGVTEENTTVTLESW
jgi:DNA polymerase epsilon subunit 1